MPFYEYEYIVQNLVDILKEKQDAEENQTKNSQMDMNPSKYMKDASKMIPSSMRSGMPNMSGLSNFPGIPSSLKI